MTACIHVKKLASGKSYYYVKLSYKDSKTGKWKSKTIGTGLEIKGNKRRAESLCNEYLDKYSYLEQPHDKNIDLNILLCDYLDFWLERKKTDLKTSTYEGYVYRVKKIKEYFAPKKMRLIDVNAKSLDDFYRYSLSCGKINQRTGAHEPMAVRSVRSYKSILFAAFTQATIDGLIKTNPAIGVRVHGKKNKGYQKELLFMTEEEISELLHFLADHYPRLMPIAFMGAYYGLRRSEILGLKWSAVDFDKKLITISHTIVRVKTIDESDNTKTPEGKRSLNLFPPP